MGKTPKLVTLFRVHRLVCVICEGRTFYDRPIQLNTAGAELFGFAWANQSATGLVCAQCGYVHSFLNDTIEFWDPDHGYPPTEG